MTRTFQARRARQPWAWPLGIGVLAALGAATWWMLREGASIRSSAPSATAPSAAVPPVPPVPDSGRGDGKAPIESKRDVPTVSAAVPGAAGDVSVGGIVVLPNGTPAAGAAVTIYRTLSAWPEWRCERIDDAYTGADGKFEFRVPQRHGLLVGFEHKAQGWAGDLQEVSLDASAMRLRLQRGFDLSGEVRGPAGAPVPNARVALESVAGDHRRARATTTAANGSYRFENLPAGPVRIVVRHPVWQPVAVPVHGIGDVVRRNFDFELPATAPFRGRIVGASSQAPIEGASVEVLPAGGRPGLSDPVTAVTDAEGRFTLAGLPRGSVRLVVRHADHGAVLRNLTVGSNPAEVVYELPSRSRVRGRITGEGRRRGLDAEVLEMRDSAGQIDYATIAGDGTFQFASSLSPGTATITVMDGAFAFERSRSRETTVAIDDGATTDLELPIEAPTVVRGRLVDAGGKPLGAATVWQTKLFADSARSIGTAITNLDIGSVGSRVFQLFGGDRDEPLALSLADGTFTLRGQKPGPLTIRIELAGHGTLWRSVVVPHDTQPLDLRDLALSRGCRIEGRVLRGGRVLAGAAVTAIGRESQAMAMTGADGRFVFVDLQPGEYAVRARLPSMPNGSNEHRVTATVDRAPPSFNLVFDSGRVVRGVVIGTDGQPVPNALVTVLGAIGQTTVTDNGGEFLLELPARTFDLQVSLGDRSRSVVVPIGAAEQNVSVRLETPPTATLTATVAGLPGRKRPAGALLRFTRRDEPSDTATRATWLELQNGDLNWPSCPVGKVRVEIWCEGFAPRVFDLECATGDTVKLGEVLLEPGARVQGEVRAPGGAPVANAMVWLGEETDVGLFEPAVRTAADGSFRLTGVTGRSSRLVVRAPGFAPRTRELQLPLDVLSPTPVAIELEPGATIEVQVANAENAVDGRVELRQGERLVAVAVVDDSGRARFHDRGAGAYTVNLLGSKTEPKAVVVPPRATVVTAQLP